MKVINLLNIASSLGANIKGCELTPYAFKLIGLNEFLSSLAKVNYCGTIEAPYITTPVVENNVKNLKEILVLCNSIANVQLEKNCFSLFIGGDQSISIGITKLLLGQYKKLGILLLESHPNANTEKTTPTGDMHGMCTAFILRRALENYANAFFGELPKPKIFMLGLRVFDRGELENIANEEVKVLDFKRSISMDLTKLVNEIKDFFVDRESIYISFAANVLTPSLAPGVCTPSKDGYVPEYVEEILRQLVIQKLNITALEVSEINLLKDKEGQTLTYGFNIIKKLLNEIFST